MDAAAFRGEQWPFDGDGSACNSGSGHGRDKQGERGRGMDADRGGGEGQHAPLRVIFFCVLVKAFKRLISPQFQTPSSSLYWARALELWVCDCEFELRVNAMSTSNLPDSSSAFQGFGQPVKFEW